MLRPASRKPATDIVKAKGVVAGGLGAENSKDLLNTGLVDRRPAGEIRHHRDRAQPGGTRLALQQNEINLYSESPPSYRAVVEPSLVRDGVVIPIWYEAIPDGEAFKPPKQVEGLPILPFHQLHTQVKGTMPAGQLWDTYRAVHTINGSMQRQVGCVSAGRAAGSGRGIARGHWTRQR